MCLRRLTTPSSQNSSGKWWTTTAGSLTGRVSGGRFVLCLLSAMLGMLGSGCAPQRGGSSDYQPRTPDTQAGSYEDGTREAIALAEVPLEMLLASDLPMAEQDFDGDRLDLVNPKDVEDDVVCTDEDPSTVDFFHDSTCWHETYNCDDGNDCTVDYLDGCHCIHDLADLPGCCIYPEACDDNQLCTSYACVDFHCTYYVKKTPNCTQWCGYGFGASSCTPSTACETSWCDDLTNTCAKAVKSIGQQLQEGLCCCDSDEDCMVGGVWEEDGDGDGKPGPDISSTLDLCVDGQCRHTVVPDECDCSGDIGACPIADSPCTESVCIADCVCGLELIQGCCKADVDCYDNDPITKDVCEDGECAHIYVDEGVCHWGPYGCQDLEVPPCAFSHCVEELGGCYTFLDFTLWPILSCCQTDDDCGDCDPGTIDTCIDYECVHTVGVDQN